MFHMTTGKFTNQESHRYLREHNDYKKHMEYITNDVSSQYNRYSSLGTPPSSKYCLWVNVRRNVSWTDCRPVIFHFQTKINFLKLWELLNFHYFRTLNDLSTEQWFKYVYALNNDFQIRRPPKHTLASMLRPING